MKTILVAVVGTIGLVATPAVAGSKKPPITKPTVEPKQIAEADATKPALDGDRVANAATPAVDTGRLASAATPALDAGRLASAATPALDGGRLASAATPAAPLAPAVVGSSTAPVALAPIGDATAPAEVAPSPELLAIPVLPADTSNALTQLDLVTPRAVVLAPAKKAKPGKARALDLGDHYVLGGHKVESTAPREDVVHFVPRGLSAAQVSTVVQQSSADLQVCWAKLPAAQRADRATAMLTLSIDDAGKVTGVELGGDVPASTHACITSVVKRWQFPTAETGTVIETGVSMRSL